MPTPLGDLFQDSSASREYAECGRSFVPERKHHEYCGRCFERKQRRQPRDNESNAEWVERLYGQK